MTKKLGQAFQGLRVQGRARFALQTTQFPLETVRFPQGTVVASIAMERNLLSPKIAQQGVAKCPQAFCEQFPKGFAGRYSKGVPYVKRPFDAAFSHKNERGQDYRLKQSGGTTWAGTALTNTHPFSP